MDLFENFVKGCAEDTVNNGDTTYPLSHVRIVDNEEGPLTPREKAIAKFSAKYLALLPDETKVDFAVDFVNLLQFLKYGDE